MRKPALVEIDRVAQQKHSKNPAPKVCYYLQNLLSSSEGTSTSSWNVTKL